MTSAQMRLLPAPGEPRPPRRIRQLRAVPYVLVGVLGFGFAGFSGLLVALVSMWVASRYAARIVAIGAAATLGLAAAASVFEGSRGTPTLAYASERDVAAELARSAAVLLMVAVVALAARERAPFTEVVPRVRAGRRLGVVRDYLPAFGVGALAMLARLLAGPDALDAPSVAMFDSLRAGHAMDGATGIHPPLAAIVAVFAPVSAVALSALACGLSCFVAVTVLQRSMARSISISVAVGVVLAIALVPMATLAVSIAVLGIVGAGAVVAGLEARRLELPRSFGAGMCIGLAALAVPVAVAGLPAIAAWSGYRAGSRRAAYRAAGVVAGAMLVLAPWSLHARGRGNEWLPGLGSSGALAFAFVTIAAVAVAGLRFRIDASDLDAFFERSRGNLATLRLLRPGPGAATVDAPVDARRHVVLGSVWMTASVAAGAVGGTAFWLLAANLYTASAVGTAAALFSSLAFVNYATGMGLVVAVPRFAGRVDESSDVLFSWGLLYTAVTSAVGAVAFLVLFHTGSSRALSEWGWLVGGAVFTTIAVGTGLYVMVDARLIVARRWDLVFVRVVVINVLRVPLLFTPYAGDALWVFLLSSAPLAIAGFIGVARLPGRVTGRYRLFPRPPVWRAALRFTHVNYAAMLAYWAPMLVLPVIVLVAVPARVNASFYVAFSIVSVMFLVPSTITQVLLSEGSLDASSRHAQARTAFLLTVGLMFVALVGAIVAAPLITVVYGPSYRKAADILPWLVAGGIPWAVTCVAITVARLRNGTVATLLIPTVLAVATIVPALYLVPDGGLTGVTQAWLVGNVAAALVSAAVLRGKGFRTPERRALPVAPLVDADD
jgi:O-antigen/teichoic acid export membrane protein